MLWFKCFENAVHVPYTVRWDFFSSIHWVSPLSKFCTHCKFFWDKFDSTRSLRREKAIGVSPWVVHRKPLAIRMNAHVLFLALDPQTHHWEVRLYAQKATRYSNEPICRKYSGSADSPTLVWLWMGVADAVTRLTLNESKKFRIRVFSTRTLKMQRFSKLLSDVVLCSKQSSRHSSPRALGMRSCLKATETIWSIVLIRITHRWVQHSGVQARLFCFYSRTPTFKSSKFNLRIAYSRLRNWLPKELENWIFLYVINSAC